MVEAFRKFEAVLEDMRARLERLEEKLGPQPLCFTYPDAAKRLGVGLTKLKQMVRAGEIQTSRVGRVPMISLAELERISTPPAERPKLERAMRAKAWKPIAKRR
jgi:excisionase family DNA binding protein